MRIGELADRTGSSPRLLRYYEEQGLLSSGRDANGYRVYGDGAVGRVQQIRGLLESGIPTRIIRDMLPCLRAGELLLDTPSPDALRRLTEVKEALERRIACLSRNHAAISAYLAASVEGDGGDPHRVDSDENGEQGLRSAREPTVVGVEAH
ncbi:MerR family transcriptional regulator [Mycetocola reblochoni]|uniref:MerR family transcriptional regulator n=1 Tax=Mycetocola reblochoni TaxID=331618 RepID=UPI003F954763